MDEQSRGSCCLWGSTTECLVISTITFFHQAFGKKICTHSGDQRQAWICWAFLHLFVKRFNNVNIQGVQFLAFCLSSKSQTSYFDQFLLGIRQGREFWELWFLFRYSDSRMFQSRDYQCYISSFRTIFSY